MQQVLKAAAMPALRDTNAPVRLQNQLLVAQALIPLAMPQLVLSAQLAPTVQRQPKRLHLATKVRTALLERHLAQFAQQVKLALHRMQQTKWHAARLLAQVNTLSLARASAHRVQSDIPAAQLLPCLKGVQQDRYLVWESLPAQVHLLLRQSGVL